MTNNEPWNPDRPDLLRVGVEAAARVMHDIAEADYGEPFPRFEDFRTEWEEDAVRVIRAYVEAAGELPLPPQSGDSNA